MTNQGHTLDEDEDEIYREDDRQRLSLVHITIRDARTRVKDRPDPQALI